MAPSRGLVLTSAKSLESFERATTTGKVEVVKVVTGHGLGRAWDAAAIAATCRLGKRRIIRTVWGDPSYRAATGEDYSLPYAGRVVDEVMPWLAADPLAVIEIGNEWHLQPSDSETWAFQYAYHLGQAIDACRKSYPRAKICAPAHMLNHAVRLGSHADGVARCLEIAAPQYRKCDYLGLHAYTVDQAQRGIRQLRTLVSDNLPIWLTEFALNEQLADDIRGRRYRAIADGLPVEVACLYHWDELGGDDPVHFNPNYRLSLATLAAFAAEPAATPAPAPAPAPARSPTLASLGIVDIRGRLDVIASRRPAPRRVPVRSATLHYNGPSVTVFGDPAAELRHVIEVDTPHHQQNPRVRGDSLQYHIVVLSDGSILQTRDLALPASHCGDAEGNRSSLAIHLPLGGTQDATAAQWSATCLLFEALITEYRLAGRSAIKGHDEWSATLCPGPQLKRRLLAWRAGVSPDGAGLYRIRADVAAANVREGPGTRYPVALVGKARMWPGDVLDVDALVDGEPVGGDPTWLHRRDGLGFVHRSVTERL